MDPRDLIVQNADGSCGSSVADADQIGALASISFPILGTPFLRSVVAVFDFGKDEMRFAERVYPNKSTVTAGNSTVDGCGSSTGGATSESTASGLVISVAGSQTVIRFATLVAVVLLSVELVL